MQGRGLGVVTGTEHIDIEADQVVVDPAAVEGEESHHGHHVPQLRNCAQRRFLDCFIKEHQVQAKGQEHQSVPDIPEHHSKEKGECHAGEDARVHLFIAGDPVGVSDLLSNRSIRVGREHGRRSAERDGLQSGTRLHVRQPDGQLIHLILGNVDICEHELASVFQLVQGLVDVLLLDEEILPFFYAFQFAYFLEKSQQLFLFHLYEILELFELYRQGIQAVLFEFLADGVFGKAVGKCLKHLQQFSTQDR